MATTTKHRVNAEEFLTMDLGEGIHELVRGEILRLEDLPYAHGYVCANIGAILRRFGRTTSLGHNATNFAPVVIDSDTVRRPDVCHYSEARWPRARIGQERPPVPPDLVVEVYSPSDRPGKMLEKVGDYLQAGVAMVWVVHPEKRNLTIYRYDDPTPTVLTDSDRLENLPELPGFACRVAEFFE